MTNEDLIPDVKYSNCNDKAWIYKEDVSRQFQKPAPWGKGIKGMQTIEDDYIEDLIMTTAHHYIMFFTNKGRAYRIKAYEIPDAQNFKRNGNN